MDGVPKYGTLPASMDDDVYIGKCGCWKKYGGHISGGILTMVFVTAAVLAVTLLRTPVTLTPNQLTMEDILGGKFSANTYSPVWLSNGDFLYEHSNTSRLIYRYSSTSFTSSLFLNCSNLSIGNFTYGTAFGPNFYPSTDLSYILFPVHRQKQYRSSFFAQWIIYDVTTQQSAWLFNGAMAANPTWNPNPSTADSLAMVVDNNIMLISQLKNSTIFNDGGLNGAFEDLTANGNGMVTNITTDGSSLIFNGIMDWLYEEEVFESSPALYWSPDGSQLAFLKLNDTLVGEVSYPWFVDPSVSPYPQTRTVRYPKAGTTNPTASAHIYTLATGSTITLQLLPNTEYITSIGWIPTRPGEISVRVLPRLQQIETLLVNNASNGLTLSSIVTQNMTGGWVESRPYSYIWIDDRRFIDIRANKDWYHIAMMSIFDGSVSFITSGNWTVTQIVGYESSFSHIYYIGTQDGSINRNLYRVPLHGNPELLSTNGTTTHGVHWGPGGIYILDGSSSVIPPKQWVVSKTSFSFNNLLADNTDLLAMLENYNMPTKEFTTVAGAYGYDLNAYLVLPHGYISGILYPVLFTYYNGPTSNRVLDAWTLGFNEWIATRSKMIVVCIDAAGTGGRSISFNQQTYLRLGVKETFDQLQAITNMLQQRRDMDWNRVGCWGWSYGGFMTIMLALNGHGMFNGAVSVAPVTDWRLYDTFYTERYMQTPSVNAAGYNETSTLHLADLNGQRYLNIEMQNRTNLFVVHGLADDNVHFQNSAVFVQRLISDDIAFSMSYYPNQAHSISENGALLQLYHQFRAFFKQNVIDFLYYDLHPDS